MVGRRWSDSEISLLKEFYPSTNASEIANRLGRSTVAIRLKAQRLGVRKATNPLTDVRTDDLTPAQLGYLAGMVDGEGHITLTKCGRRLTPSVAIHNTNLNLLKVLQKWVGGSICESRYRKSHPNWNPHYWLRFEGYRKVRKILTSLEPFLILKRNQARLMLKFCDLRMRHPNKFYTQEELELARRIRKHGV